MNIFKVDTIENAGDNWLIADFGMDSDGKHYILVTDHVHASQLTAYSDGAKGDAERVAKLLNDWFIGESIGDYVLRRITGIFDDIAEQASQWGLDEEQAAGIPIMLFKAQNVLRESWKRYVESE